MIERLPQYAETKLQGLCAEAGALCHRVYEDESGWDFLIEFPAREYSGPADTRPVRHSAYVQVKSTKTSKMSCRVRLSNALRAAESDQPWFIVFVSARGGPDSLRLFVVHFWDTHIRQTLEAVRRAEAAGQPLNRIWLTIQFAPSDEQGADLISWMVKQIEVVKPEYDDAKRSLYRTVGYETGYGQGLFTIEANTEEEIIENFLGLGSGLKVNKFTFTPSRFGISAAKPQVDVSSATLHIDPIAAGDIEFRLRSSQHQLMVLPGKAYGMNIPGADETYRRVRFSAHFINVIWQPTGTMKFSVGLDPTANVDLITLENYATLHQWLAAGPIDIQVWKEGKRALAGSLDTTTYEHSPHWAKASALVRLVRSIAGTPIDSQIKVSLRDLGMSPGAGTLSEISAAPSFMVEFIDNSEAPEKVTNVLYWIGLDVGEHVFYALAERPVKHDSVVGETRRVIGGMQRIVESYVLTNPTVEDRNIIRKDYDRRFALLEETGSTLGLGELHEFVANTIREQKRMEK